MDWPTHYKKPASVDKTGWPPGPWHDEPDWQDFEAHGLECRVMRHPQHGHLCGYVQCSHEIPYALLPEDISGGSDVLYGFDTSPPNGYWPGSHADWDNPADYRTFREVQLRTEDLAAALARQSVWWRRALRALARLRLHVRWWSRRRRA